MDILEMLHKYYRLNFLIPGKVTLATGWPILPLTCPSALLLERA